MAWRGPGLLAACALALAAAGCGNPNVEACRSWQRSIIALPCVGSDYETGLACSSYEDHPCDATEYFECLEDSYSCSDDGNFQPPDTTACFGLLRC